jgi:urea transport system permease protein
MGVINMAHGELLMVGAYATWAMQSLFRLSSGALDWYLLAAVPVAFLAAALVGVLHGAHGDPLALRPPLETLLATWGMSLMLIQAARALFGAQNVEVANPRGCPAASKSAEPRAALEPHRHRRLRALRAGRDVGDPEQDAAGHVRPRRDAEPADGRLRRRADRRIDTWPSPRRRHRRPGRRRPVADRQRRPDMGQGYIVDSFMVVVLGGVGQLAGAVWAALGLGVVTKFLEGWTGAVIAKIVVLVFIIMFIQKRPQGLFALKGRFVES